jgi:hypothetical protein
LFNAIIVSIIELFISLKVEILSKRSEKEDTHVHALSDYVDGEAMIGVHLELCLALALVDFPLGGTVTARSVGLIVVAHLQGPELLLGQQVVGATALSFEEIFIPAQRHSLKQVSLLVVLRLRCQTK